MNPVPAREIQSIHADADVLVHVESFSLKDRLVVRHSFSTKLVDYFHAARCVFAVAPPDVASMCYLLKNDSAVVATSEHDVIIQLRHYRESKSCSPIRPEGLELWEEKSPDKKYTKMFA